MTISCSTYYHIRLPRDGQCLITFTRVTYNPYAQKANPFLVDFCFFFTHHEVVTLSNLTTASERPPPNTIILLSAHATSCLYLSRHTNVVNNKYRDATCTKMRETSVQWDITRQRQSAQVRWLIHSKQQHILKSADIEYLIKKVINRSYLYIH